jgi:hypothetical protein
LFELIRLRIVRTYSTGLHTQLRISSLCNNVVAQADGGKRLPSASMNLLFHLVNEFVLSEEIHDSETCVAKLAR